MEAGQGFCAKCGTKAAAADLSVCRKCNNNLDLGQDFCDKCGHKAGEAVNASNQTYSSQIIRREKSEGGAAILSFLWGGIGQIYVGRIGRGLGIIAAYVVLMVVGIASIMGSRTLVYSHSDWWYDYFYYSYEGPLLILGVLLILACFVLLIWNVFDAYNLAKQYNTAIRQTGNPPW
jgi:TM2 domain-containing membrane protein YozV